MHSALASSMLPLLLWLLATATGVCAHWDWVKDFPNCWGNCLRASANGYGDGCASSECICDASQSANFLPSAVSCIAKKCDANDFALRLSLLLPLEGYCNFVGDEIPDDVMSSAYAAATVTATSAPKATTIQKVDPGGPKTTKGGGGGYGATDVFTSTFTGTTTNQEGKTLQIVVPVVIGKETISYGKTITSTLEEKTTVQSTTSAAPQSSTQVISPEPTQTEQRQSSSSTVTSAAPRRTSNNNGSPFDNMQAGAGRREISSVFTGLGTIIIGMVFTL